MRMLSSTFGQREAETMAGFAVQLRGVSAAARMWAPPDWAVLLTGVAVRQAPMGVRQ